MNRLHTLVLLAACRPPISLDGEWLGSCSPEQAFDLRANIFEQQPADGEPYVYLANVTRSDPDLGEVAFSCADIQEDRTEVSVAGCQMSDGGGASDLAWSGSIERAEPVATWSGTCSFLGDQGSLLLWRLP
jgi:hypothetical protein